jgi:hypothetical protein
MTSVASPRAARPRCLPTEKHTSVQCANGFNSGTRWAVPNVLFSREETRVHVHVEHPDGEAKFWLTPMYRWSPTLACQSANCAMPRRWSWLISRRLKMPGTLTSVAEVTHVSKHGFWLLLGAEELLVPFEHFPWFKKATIEQLSDVQWPTPNHLYWPQLDADLSVESIRDPSAFPLVSKAMG